MSREVRQSTAAYLRAGDVFDFGTLAADRRDAITVDHVYLSPDGYLRVTGRFTAGSNRARRCIWQLQFTQPVEFSREVEEVTP